MKQDPKQWVGTVNPSARIRDEVASEFMDAQVLLAAPKQLMTSLRDIMAGTAAPQRQMEDIVKLVAKELRADSCACFVQRPGEVLELFAASGVAISIKNSIKIHVGEGLVGEVAAEALPLAIDQTESHAEYVPHPLFDIHGFKSFCGVPILRGGTVRGVLVVQNTLPRKFNSEIIDILQTVAMVLAELIVAGGLVPASEFSTGFLSVNSATHIEGVALGRGLAIGRVVLYEPRLVIKDIVAADSKAQKRRLQQALSTMQGSISRMLTHDMGDSATETRDILEAYQMFARDRGWITKIEQAIDKGLSAEAAVQSALNEARVRMQKMNDAYIKERLQDLEELSNRLLSHLVRQGEVPSNENMPDDIILLARTMGPAALLDFDRKKLKAVVLEKGGHSNHVAIVARSLGIPIIGQCGDVLSHASAGDQMIVDGDHGTAYLRPSPQLIDLYTRSLESRAKRSGLYHRAQKLPSITKDNVKISVQMNAGLYSEVETVFDKDADGIGLFRTELAFMGWKKYPLVIKQAELYSKIMDQMGEKPVVFRTLDIGGDKPLPYFKAPDEENPALGWRAVRIGMDRPAVLRTQFRAFIRGSKGRDLKIMLPLVTEVAEYDQARKYLEMEKERAKRNNIPVPKNIALGVMLEVPALIWQLDSLLKTVDFISVGTNDLMQYLYAADRGNDALRNRYDPLSPAMLKALKTIADQCRDAGVPVSVCGEMAGQPLDAMVLITLGYETLSMSAQSLESVKTMIPTLDTKCLKPYLEQLMHSRGHSLRERLLSFARDHHINI